MDRAILRGKAQTVGGLVDPDRLGPTLMHEHLLGDLTPPSLAALGDPGPEINLQNVWAINYGRVPHAGKYRLDAVDVAVSELNHMREAGGRTVVELSSGGLRPDPVGLVKIAEGAGVHIVMGCGYYVEDYVDPGQRGKTVDRFAQDIIGQVLEGAWDSEVRAGIIGEIGCQSPWTDMEKRVMHGAVIAQRETGAAINVHPGADADQPQEVAEFVRRAGGDTERTVISHIDRTIFDEARLLRLADTGCVVEFDLFGMEQSYWPWSDVDLPNDGARLKLIRALIGHGHLRRIVISHDISRKTRLRRFGGHGYDHIFTNVIPLMRRRGFSQDEIDTIMVNTPRRLLTFD